MHYGEKMFWGHNLKELHEKIICLVCEKSNKSFTDSIVSISAGNS